MEIDRLKLAGVLKTFLLFTYIIYFYFFNSNFFNYIPSEKGSSTFKSNLINNKCLILLGGSNVVQGLSAELLSKNFCEASNLGVNAELGSFHKYVKWLDYNLKSKNFIYSSSIFYSLEIDDGEYKSIEIPNIALYTVFKNLILDPRYKFNEYGDLIDYNCKSHLRSHEIDAEKFINSNNIITNEIKKRILIIKTLTHSDNVYFRIPPIYVGKNENSDLYKYIIGQRIQLLKDLNIKIIGETTVSADSSLFCDSFHPNAKGREVFSKEIIFP